MSERDLLREARESYERGENVMELFRSALGSGRNTTDAVLVSYDLQSGSYRALLDDPDQRARLEHYVRMVAGVLAELDHDSVLEPGAGEATTLMGVLANLPRPPARVAAMDLSWSRVAHARAHARSFAPPAPELFAGDMFSLPVADGAFDLVYTSHALEPNGGRELEGVAELARVTRRWLVLFEPGYELAGESARRRMEEHGYVRGLPDAARALGLELLRHELLPGTRRDNETAVLVLRKPDEPPAPERWRACPRCRGGLDELHGHLFCAAEGLVYPVLDGIPCLDPRNAILASAFAETP